MGPVLEVTGLSKTYGAQAALTGVALQLERGTVLGLLGPNGSGKSTMLHCIAGITEPDSGEILINGAPHFTRDAKASLGFMPDDLAMPENLTGAEYLDLIYHIQPRADRTRLEDLVSIMNMDEAMTKLISQYSHGMKRRLQIVVGLSHQPDLLIMDEPFRGLDPEARIILRTTITEFVQHGGSILTSTHDLFAAGAYCDEVAILAGGALVATGTPSRLMAEHSTGDLAGVFMSATRSDERPGDEPAERASQYFAVHFGPASRTSSKE